MKIWVQTNQWLLIPMNRQDYNRLDSLGVNAYIEINVANQDESWIVMIVHEWNQFDSLGVNRAYDRDSWNVLYFPSHLPSSYPRVEWCQRYSLKLGQIIKKWVSLPSQSLILRNSGTGPEKHVQHFPSSSPSPWHYNNNKSISSLTEAKSPLANFLKTFNTRHFSSRFSFQPST